MTDFALSNGADQFIGTAGDDAVIATDGTLSASDQLNAGDQSIADIMELRNAGNGIVDAQFAGVRGFEVLEITDTTTAVVRLTLRAQASAAFSFSGSGNPASTFAPKAYFNASNLTSQQTLILDARGWIEPAGTTDRGLRVSLGAGANQVWLSSFDDRVLVRESTLGANDRIDGGAGFDVFVVQDDGGTFLTDSVFSSLKSFEVLRLGDFLPGSPSKGSFRVQLGTLSQRTGITEVDARFNQGHITINASQRDQSLVVRGSLGGDFVFATKDADTIFGNRGNDKIFGLDGNDRLQGGAGNDRLNGGLGADRMAGGLGNDVYIVNESGDRVFESANGGYDQVKSFITFVLGTGLERLDLLGGQHIDGTGNSLNNAIFGNSGDNFLYGMAGSDRISGGAGNDMLSGGLGRDFLNGGGGDDILELDRNDALAHGGAGLDTVMIDSLGPSLVLSKLVGKVFDGIEVIDLGGSQDNLLILDPKTIGSSELLVKGDIGDAIAIAGAWTKGATLVNPGGVIGTFVEYTNGGSIVLSEDDVTVYASTFDLSTLNGRSGFRLIGDESDDFAGTSVAGIGDINGDGYADFMIGAPGSSAGAVSFAGVGYVLFGKAGIWDPSIELSTLDGKNGFHVNGTENSSYTGYSVSGAGDINGDGFADFIIGAYLESPGGATDAGASYVVFGKASWSTDSLELASLSGTDGFSLIGLQDDKSGFSVSSAGDVNGDGFDDLIIGAYYHRIYNPGVVPGVGTAYIVFGKSDWSGTPSVDLGSLDGTNGFQVVGKDIYFYTGQSVASVGDVNGDGFDDLIIGAPYASSGSLSENGETYIVFGKANWSASPSLDPSTLNGINGFVLTGAGDDENSGRSVASAGDVNGDGFSDFIICTGGYDKSYLVFGKANWTTTPVLDLGSLNGTNGVTLLAPTANSDSGQMVSSAGDLNGDGFDDLIIGSAYESPDGISGAGVAYVVYGKAGGWSASLELSALDGSDGFRLDGILSDDAAGFSVASAGDVDGDGFDDLIIGAKYAGFNTGEAYIVFGGNFTGAVTHLGTVGNDVLIGTKAAETFVGDRGNDVFVSNGGLDSFQGGQGRDVIRLAGVGFRHIDGGSGVDTVRLDGAGKLFDLTAIPQAKIEGIERINITGTGNNVLKLNVHDVLDLSDTSNTLMVFGNSGDVVHRGGGWAFMGTETVGAHVFRVYESGEATLLVDVHATSVV